MDKDMLRKMVRDTLLCTAADFLDTWGATMTAHPEVFSKCAGLTGDVLLSEVRWSAMQASQPVAPTPTAAKGGGRVKVPVVVLDGCKIVEAKNFDDYNAARAWAARKVADCPGYSATVEGKTMTRDDAIAIAWGGRRASQVMAKSGSYGGPWQKVKQTRVVLPK